MGGGPGNFVAFENRFPVHCQWVTLRDGKHVSPNRLADLLSWKHSGFHIKGGALPPGNTAASTLKVARYRRKRMPKEWERTGQERTARRILALSVLPVWHAACVEAALPLCSTSSALRASSNPQSTIHNLKAPEVPLDDGRILVLEYT